MANNELRQTSTAYTSNGGVYMTAETEKHVDTEQVTIIHTVPKMTGAERDKAKKRISNDLFEVFSRIQAQLNFDNELIDS